jgi:hypothetical protein
MNAIFDIIPLTDAIAKFRIDENIYESRDMFEDIVKADARFYLYEGDLALDDHFMLDADNLQKGTEGYIINGNLKVKGNIINEEGDYGPALYVAGSVECSSMLIGGAPVHITGDVTAEEVIMLHYNHGWMRCPGMFTAPVMIGEDYHFVPDRKNISNFYYNDHDPASPKENECFENDTMDQHISENLLALLDNKLTTTFEELRYDLAAGESVLRPVERNVHYWRRKISRNYRDLKRVPFELRTHELCMQALGKSVSAIQYFPSALITPELIEQAVNISGTALRYLPETVITRELCIMAAAKGAIIDLDIPERFYDDALLQILIRHSDFQMERIPLAYIKEELLVTYVKTGRGAWLDKYCDITGVSKERVLYRVIDGGVQYLENIFGWHFSADTYAYAKSIYGNETYSKEWTEITQKYKRKLERL